MAEGFSFLTCENGFDHAGPKSLKRWMKWDGALTWANGSGHTLASTSLSSLKGGKNLPVALIPWTSSLLLAGAFLSEHSFSFSPQPQPKAGSVVRVYRFLKHIIAWHNFLLLCEIEKRAWLHISLIFLLSFHESFLWVFQLPGLSSARTYGGLGGSVTMEFVHWVLFMKSGGHLSPLCLLLQATGTGWTSWWSLPLCLVSMFNARVFRSTVRDQAGRTVISPGLLFYHSVFSFFISRETHKTKIACGATERGPWTGFPPIPAGFPARRVGQLPDEKEEGLVLGLQRPRLLLGDQGASKTDL